VPVLVAVRLMGTLRGTRIRSLDQRARRQPPWRQPTNPTPPARDGAGLVAGTT
jgi:hypothetical protein